MRDCGGVRTARHAERDQADAEDDDDDERRRLPKMLLETTFRYLLYRYIYTQRASQPKATTSFISRAADDDCDLERRVKGGCVRVKI